MKRHAARLAAIAVLFVLYSALHASKWVSTADLEAAAQRFAFERTALPDVPGQEIRRLRKNAHPDLAHLRWYISSLGAAVALNDLDGDGLPNDLCHVDTRTDQVIISPAPGTPRRYAAFSLNQGPLFDRETMAPMGCVPSDTNEDGRMDLLVYYAGRSPILFLKGKKPIGPDAYFASEPFAKQVWSSSAATFADLDGDGHLDLVVGNYFQDGAEIFNKRAVQRVYMNDSFSRAQNGGGVRIYRWERAIAGDAPTVVYTDVTEAALPKGVEGGWTLALGAQDIDGDLLPEIYQANDHGPDHLLHNRSIVGKISFARLEGRAGIGIPKSKVLGNDSFKSMGVDFGDINNDGLPDIYVSNVTDPIAFQESQFAFISTGKTELVREGVAPYVDRSQPLGLAQSGWCWDVKLVDFDNDGVLEALETCGFIAGKTERWAEYQELGGSNDQMTKSPKWWPRLEYGDALSGDDVNPFFAMVGDRYEEIGELIGFRETAPSRGIAVADVDGDGDADMAVANMWEDSTFYRNKSPTANSYVGLRLVLPPGTDAERPMATYAGHRQLLAGERYAVGAAATVELEDGRKFVQQVDGGNGHAGRRDNNLLFGLGAYDGTVKVSLRWRDHTGAPQNATINLRQGWHTIVLGPSNRG